MTYPISDGELLNLAIKAGLNPAEVHPAQHENFGWCTFAKLVMDALASAPAQGEVVAYIVGNSYRTQAGELVRFVSVHNEGTRYETMADETDVHRYTRRDFGRVTGTAHDYSDPRNVPPLYTHPAQPVAVREAWKPTDLLDCAEWLEAGASLALNHKSKTQGEFAAKVLRSLTVIPVGVDQKRACIEGAVTAESAETKSAGGEA